MTRLLNNAWVQLLVTLAVLVAVLDAMPRGGLGPYVQQFESLKHYEAGTKCGTGGLHWAYSIERPSPVLTKLRAELIAKGWNRFPDESRELYRVTYGNFLPVTGTASLRPDYLEKDLVSLSFSHQPFWKGVANILFLVGHTALILFNVLGWIWPRTRKWNLATLGATLFSWAVMGFCYGVGYCVCTDLHWQLRESMGMYDNGDSYLTFLVRSFSGWEPPPSLVNFVALAAFVISFITSTVLNVRDHLEIKAAQ